MVATPVYSVVVPIFHNEGTLPELLRQLAACSSTLDETLELIFVIDGSPDQSYALLKTALPAMPFASKLVSLSRNFGSFAAIRAGMSIATGDAIAFLAADLQQPISSLAQFRDALRRGADIAIGQRARRGDPLLSRLASSAFWRVYRRFVQPGMPTGGIDAFACTPRVRDVLTGLPEANSTLVGLLMWVGFERAFVTYDRAPRPTGASRWTWRRKVRYAFDSIFAFSDLPITTMLVAGIVGVVTALAVGIVVLAAWVTGAVSVAGYTPIMLAILLTFSINLLAIGMIGGYVWRIFENTKGRPSHIIRSVEEMSPSLTQAVEQRS